MAGAALRAARRQARAEAAVKYNPEQRVLIDALASAQSNALGTIQSARGGSSALRAAINRARPGLKRGYRDAAATAQAARGDLIGHLDHLGAAAVPFSAAVAREQAGVTSRAAQERANALGELAVRAVQAREGGLSAELNARRQLAADQSTIFRQLGGVASDRGAFTASAIADIRQAQRVVSGQNQRASIQAGATVKGAKIRAGATVKGAQIRAGATRGAARNRAGAAQAKAHATAVRQKKARTASALDQIDLAVTQIHNYSSVLPSHLIRQALTGQVLTDKNGKKVPIKPIKGVGGISRHDLINAAYDVAVHGTLSRPNRSALSGIYIRPEWRAPVPRRIHPVAAARLLPL